MAKTPTMWYYVCHMSEIYCVVRGVLFELPEPIATATTAPGLAIVAMLVRNGSLTYAADYVPEREDFVTAITVPDGTETSIQDFWHYYYGEGDPRRNCHFFIAGHVLQMAGVTYSRDDVTGSVAKDRKSVV